MVIVMKPSIFSTDTPYVAVTFEPLVDLNQKILDMTLRTRMMKIRAQTPEPQLPTEDERKAIAADIMKRRASAQITLEPFFLTEINLKNFSLPDKFLGSNSRTVEDSEYPGFNEQGPTALPEATTPHTLLERVIEEFQDTNVSI